MLNDSKAVSNVSTGSLSVAMDIAIPQKPIKSLTPTTNNIMIIKTLFGGKSSRLCNLNYITSQYCKPMLVQIPLYSVVDEVADETLASEGALGHAPELL